MKRRSASPSPKKTNTGGRSRPSAKSAKKGAKDIVAKANGSPKAAPAALSGSATKSKGKPASGVVAKPVAAGKSVNAARKSTRTETTSAASPKSTTPGSPVTAQKPTTSGTSTHADRKSTPSATTVKSGGNPVPTSVSANKTGSTSANKTVATAGSKSESGAGRKPSANAASGNNPKGTAVGKSRPVPGGKSELDAARKSAPSAASRAPATSPAPSKAGKAAPSGNGKAAPTRPKDARSHPKPLDRASRAAAEEREYARTSPLQAHADFQNPPLKKILEKTVLGADYRSALRGPLRDSGLPRRLAHGAILPALLGDGRMGQLREQLDWAIEDRVPAFYLAESILQSYLFIGFPRTINALILLHEVTQQRRRSLGLAADSLHVQTEIPSFDRILGGPTDLGSGLRGRRIRLAEGPPMHLEGPGESPGSFERYAREWWRRGSELCAQVYGSQYHRLRENLTRIHPELADWMLFEGYGKVLSRPILTPRERELWIVPLLMVQDVPEQFFSHLRGTLNLDVPAARLNGVVWLASLVAGPAALKEALAKIVDLEKKVEDRRRDWP